MGKKEKPDTEEKIEEPQAPVKGVAESPTTAGSQIGDDNDGPKTTTPLEERGNVPPAPEPEKPPKKRKLLPHEIADLERQIRKYIKRAGGFRKGISNAEKMTANALLAKAGRKKAVWDHSIDLNMINTKSIVRPKTDPNSID